MSAQPLRLRPDFRHADTSSKNSRKTLTDRQSTGTSSMLRDVVRGARTEHDHILGDMLSRASFFHVATPVLRIADTALRVYEDTLPPSAKPVA